ncbi:MAG: type II toxin-antitoxin system RelE/ParE family toxin, partial [Chloroflexi bacterium]|nr:type II toxin-antitoxin system RelE/ParE family toxin [Chloroflexota bacterium]
IARAIWFFQKGQRIVVVRVFVKKSQKTPRLERELALTRMNDYLARYPDRK